MNYAWRFPILDGGKKQGINDSGIATFDGSELYNNLAREICQNSLDAKDVDSKNPVVVSFNLKTIYKPSFSPIDGLYNALQSCKEYWEKFEDHKLNAFLNEAFKTINSENIDILIVSDFNTNGLNGSKTKSGSWDALTGSNGVSYKISGSQGSFGIGKNAPYACSSLRTVFYNTYCKYDKIKAFQGVTSLVTHLNENNEETQGCGFYYDCINRLPIYNIENIDGLNIFSRNEYGTDIIILGFKKNINWKNDIKNAIIKNFFISILNSKLIVKIDKEEINKETIISIINNEINKTNDNNLIRIKRYCDTYINPNRIFEKKILTSNDCKLFVRTNDEYDRSISYFRSSGMLIFEKKIKNMKPYEAVLIVNDGEFNELLKLTEPPKHNRWDYKLLDEINREKGKKAIQDLNAFIENSIKTLCKLEDYDEIDPDGLSDILPDDVEDIKNKKINDYNIFNGDVVEIASIKKIKNTISTETQSASYNIGKTDLGQVHNSEKNNELYDGIIPKPGIIDNNGNNIAIKDINGSKTIITELSTNIRIIPINYNNGEYMLSCCFEKAYKKAIIELNSIGEDGTKNNLFIYKYSINNKEFINNKNYIELENVNKSYQYKIKLFINSRNRMVIVIGGVGYETK